MYYHIMYILGRLRRRYINQIPEGKSEYLNSRRAFTIDGVTAFAVLNLVSFVYLSGLLHHIGAPKTLNGIISAFPALVNVAQPMGAALAQNIKKRKPYISAGALLHRLMFTLIFFVPLFLPPSQACAVIAILLFSGHFINAFITPMANSWIISLTPQRVRGKYFGLREFYSMITAAAVLLLTGFILDYFKDMGKAGTGFLYVGVIVGILTLINTIALSRVMEPESLEQSVRGEPIAKILKMVLTEKGFRPVLILSGIFMLGIQVAVPYHGIYMVDDLKISYGFISTVSFITMIQKAVIVRRWGRLADKTSWARVCRLSVILIAASHLLNFFLTPSTWIWAYPASALIASFGWASINIALLNVQYDYAPMKGRTIYIGICGAVTGIIGFLGVFLGSFILPLADKYKPVVFGMVLKGQQILMLISGILLVSCAVYTFSVVEKKEKIINTQEGRAL
ncbi:MAG: Major Facilitator Superfamily protein [Firmicutes bacterium ADurb.Bin193]|nr:MAG: Major Facilitator Superfamily protein [Firmicutes bacterium ADurb.Bin193]